jgi:hypothetical protein
MQERSQAGGDGPPPRVDEDKIPVKAGKEDSGVGFSPHLFWLWSFANDQFCAR